MWMFPGNHEYNFEFELPNDLPDTLEDSRSRHICYNNAKEYFFLHFHPFRYAKVMYQVKASVYLTQQRVSHSLEEPFYIITKPDPSVIKPTEEEMPKVISR